MSRGPDVACVLGMHRSGTSLAAGILHHLGIYLGPPERLMGPKWDNPKGFWEYEPFTDVNDAILDRLGGRWDEPPPFPPGWDRSKALADLKEEARRLIRSDFGSRRSWGWKDPRASLTLPFWKRFLPRMRYLICLRNPVEVAHSLRRRDELPLERGVELWVRYVGASLRHTAGDPRLLLFYEDLVEAWPAEVGRLAHFLGRPVPPREGWSAIEGFVSAELRHHGTAPADVERHPGMLPRARALYASLRALVDVERGRGSAADAGPLAGAVNALVQPSGDVAASRAARRGARRPGAQDPTL